MKILRFASKYLLKYKKYLFLFITLNLFSAFFSIITPLISGKYIDNLLRTSNIIVVYRFTVIFLVISISNAFTSYIFGVINAKYTTKASIDLNFNIIEHVKRLPISFFYNMNSAYLNQRINSDSNTVITFAITNFISIFVNLFTIIFSVIILININIKITLIFTIIITAYLLIYILFRKILFRVNYRLVECQNTFFAKMNNQLDNIKFIKINSLFEDLFEELKKSFNNLYKVIVFYSRLTSGYATSDFLINRFSTIAIFFYGGFEIINKRLTIGNFTIINSYFTILIGCISYFLNLGKQYQSSLVSYLRIKEILDMQEENNGIIKAKYIQSIKVKNLSFSYDGKLNIINNFNYLFEKGKIYCVVGENGIGKSTLVNILIGLNQNYSGTILYDMKDIKTIDLYDARRRLIGVTEQEPVLINDSIKNNLKLKNYKIDDHDILSWCERLNLNDILCKFPQGINSNIYEKSTNVSGGQKQRLCQARVFLKDPDILILDEPTSALDFKNTKNLEKILFTLKKDKIIILVSHNKEIIKIADEIINIKTIL